MHYRVGPNFLGDALASGEEVGEAGECTVLSDAHPVGGAAHDLAHLVGVEVAEHPQQQHFGLIGNERRHDEVDQVGEVMGRSANWVRVTQHRALARLADLLTNGQHIAQEMWADPVMQRATETI